MSKQQTELDDVSADLLSRIKAKGNELLELQGELVRALSAQEMSNRMSTGIGLSDEAYADFRARHGRFAAAEPLRWAAIGKTDIQTGVMALVRAIEQPEGV